MLATRRASSPFASVLASTLLLLLLIVKIDADICREGPLRNDYFKISCSKRRHVEVEIVCLSSSLSIKGGGSSAGNDSETRNYWSQLPSRYLGLSNVRVLTFRNCAFPDNLNLLEVAQNLGVETNNTLRIDAPRSGLLRKHLAGFKLSSLYVFGVKYYNFTMMARPTNSELKISLDPELLIDLKLERLFIQGLPIAQKLPLGFLKGQNKLTFLELAGSDLEELHTQDLQDLEKLQELLLFDNKLRHIESGSFDSLVNLKICDISKNHLLALPAKLFHRLKKLEKLNLSQNEFASLHPDLLSHIKPSKLRSVRLNHNRNDQLQSLPPGFFSNLTTLAYVEITSNNFTSLPADLFFGATSLAALNVSNNSLDNLSPRIFESTTSLKDFRASENLMSYLPENLFANVNLERLYLNSNRLTNITSNMLNGLSELKVLQVARNNLTVIDSNVCNYLKELQFVDLSYNHLTLNHLQQPFSSLAECIHMKDLNLSYNKITKVFTDFLVSNEMKNLNLEGNQITYISINQLLLNDGSILNLKSNNISTIDLKGLEKLVRHHYTSNWNKSKSALVILEDNPLHCDCRLLDFFRYLEHQLDPIVYTYLSVTTEDMYCASPEELAGTDISTIPSQDLRCRSNSNDTNDVCSGKCTCWRLPGRRVLSVDCSQRKLEWVPPYIGNQQNWSIELNMSGNLLTSTPALNQSYLLNITTLDLSNNSITYVDPDVFSPSLRELYLHDNRISHLDLPVLKVLHDNDELRNVTLHGNKWKCNCEERFFLTTVHKRLAVFGLYDLRCEDDGRRVIDTTVSEKCFIKIGWVLGGIALVPLVILTCMLVAYCIYTKLTSLKIWLYSKKICLSWVTEEEIDKNKMYDAFISFSHKDENFVTNELVAKLESGPDPYKLCLHHRDWLAGEWIPNSIAMSVAESRRTIVVMSQNFLESEWAKIEFRTAHEQAIKDDRVRLIIILYGEVSLEDLDPEFKNVVTMNTYLKWDDPNFWKRLRYALPHFNNKTKLRKPRISEHQLAYLPVNNQQNSTTNIPLPNIPPAQPNDSTKLLAPATENEKIVENNC